MSFLKNFFSIDKGYKETLKKYEPKDGVLAIVIYILVLLLCYINGVLYVKENIYLGNQINLFTAALCILCVLIHHQPLNTLGFNKKNLFKSLILGLSFSAILLIINVTYGILGGHQFNTISKLILNFGYNFFVIALVEEIIFRGFIQTRIYGIIKNPLFAIMVTAFMFMIAHIPFQMYLENEDFLTFVANNYITLLCTFLWHIVCNFMYSKYNSIVAPTVFHAVMDWCNEIFII